MDNSPKTSVSIHSIVEIIFDIAYLCFAFIASFVMLLSAKGTNTTLLLFGIMTLVLACGDAFHLVPRIFSQLTRQIDRFASALGFGKMITSITMTVFYLLLYAVWLSAYKLTPPALLCAVIICLGAARVALCLCPQNRWSQKDAPLKWAILRNLPFFAIGIIMIALFSYTAGQANDPLLCMPLAIALSFLFYLPVVLFSNKFPALGALMLPKTMAYVWIIIMGLGLI